MQKNQSIWKAWQIFIPVILHLLYLRGRDGWQCIAVIWQVTDCGCYSMRENTSISKFCTVKISSLFILQEDVPILLRRRCWQYWNGSLRLKIRCECPFKSNLYITITPNSRSQILHKLHKVCLIALIWNYPSHSSPLTWRCSLSRHVWPCQYFPHSQMCTCPSSPSSWDLGAHPLPACTVSGTMRIISILLQSRFVVVVLQS